MKQSVIIDIGSSKVLAMVVCPAADGAIIVQNAEERTYPGYRFGELPNAAALSDTLEKHLFYIFFPALSDTCHK